MGCNLAKNKVCRANKGRFRKILKTKFLKKSDDINKI
jgi:hypothetical protein